MTPIPLAPATSSLNLDRALSFATPHDQCPLLVMAPIFGLMAEQAPGPRVSDTDGSPGLTDQ